VPLGNPVTVGSNGKATRCLGEPATDQSCWGGKFREPNVIRLNEGVGEHVRTKISPQLKQ
jgi:hypothetical protein